MVFPETTRMPFWSRSSIPILLFVIWPKSALSTSSRSGNRHVGTRRRKDVPNRCCDQTNAIDGDKDVRGGWGSYRRSACHYWIREGAHARWNIGVRKSGASVNGLWN